MSTCTIHKEGANLKYKYYCKIYYMHICKNCFDQHSYNNQQVNIIQLYMSTKHLTIKKEDLASMGINLDGAYFTIINEFQVVFIF